MTEPQEYVAIVALRDRLRQIDSNASPDRYFHRVEDVAVKLDPDQGLDEILGVYPLVLLEPTGDLAFVYEPCQQKAVTFGVRATWIHSAIPAEDRDASPPAATADHTRALLFWRACSDIENAIDQPGDVSLGGVCVEVRIVGRQWDREINGQHVAAVVDLSIKVRRAA